jgi:hypothetical protein
VAQQYLSRGLTPDLKPWALHASVSSPPAGLCVRVWFAFYPALTMGPAAILLGGRGFEPRTCPQANARGSSYSLTPHQGGCSFQTTLVFCRVPTSPLLLFMTGPGRPRQG